jgi:uncharacterized protein YneF (UPF0154 family)
MRKFLEANRLFFICFVFVIAFWTARIIAVNYAGYSYGYATNSNSYNSDEIAQQNILRDWQSGYRAKVSVGDDNWFIKYPIYVLTNNLPVNPISKLLITTFIIMYITAFFALYSIYRFIDIFVLDKRHRKRSLVLMSMFLAILPGEAFHTLSMPNSRNIEVGLTLFLLLQLYRSLFDKHWLRAHFRPKLVLLFLLLSSLIADDPLFLYIVVAPIALTAFGLYVVDKLKSNYFWRLALFIFSAFIGAHIIKSLIVWLTPLSFTVHSSDIVSVSQFENNINLFLQFGLRIFGADAWGAHFRNARTIIRLTYILVLGLACYFLGRGYRRNNNLFYGALGSIFIWNIVTFLINSEVTDSTATRYLIYAVPIEIIGLLLAVAAIKTTRQYMTVLAVLSVGLILSFFLVVKTITKDYHEQPNMLDEQVISAIQKNGLTKGYGNYWLAGIQTYLSNNKIHELSIYCNLVNSKPKLKISLLLSEDGALFLQHPSKSFLVYSPLYQASSCSPSQLVPLLGQPAKLLNFGGPSGDTMAIYNYDIASKINYK